jgi:hypothetical protein
MKTFVTSLGIAFGFILLGSSSASHAMGPARSSNACEIDVSKFCLGVLEQGHSELVSCLKSHESELSDDCKAAIGLK